MWKIVNNTVLYLEEFVVLFCHTSAQEVILGNSYSVLGVH